ncbi:hypothetical protein UlMin_005990 [Ulmus minor]
MAHQYYFLTSFFIPFCFEVAVEDVVIQFFFFFLFFSDYGGNHHGNGGRKLSVLKDPTGCEIDHIYDLDRELGRGGIGVTYLCRDKENGDSFACKMISKKKLTTPVHIDYVRREVEIMKRMPKHPNIVALKDTFEDDSAVYLVMDLCEGGELYDRIVARGHYTEQAAAALIKTIVKVVLVCHKHGVIHRDLKPENFLFSNKKETAPLKAIDFGLSVFFKPGEIFTEIVGSPYYIAPEVLKQNYGPEVDVWSAGVILYILLCGAPPFPAGVAKSSVIDFNSGSWPKVSDNAKDLVKKMLDPDPKRRITAQEVLDHPWLPNANIAPKVSLGETSKARHKEYNRGKISSDELEVGFRYLSHHIPDLDFRTLMEAVDGDKDGYLDYGEFVATYVQLRKICNDEGHLDKAFEFFDKNLNGFIEIEVLQHCLIDDIEENSEEVINAIMHNLDTDKDGQISFKEFVAMMKADTGFPFYELTRDSTHKSGSII